MKVVVVLSALLAIGCGAAVPDTSRNSINNNRPFEVIMGDEIVAVCDKIRTHTHAMVQCMDDDYNTVGYFSTERVNVIRQPNGY